jgi:FkbM family methyltransferase
MMLNVFSGNMMKSTTSMNLLQSYEMQALLAPGDIFVDVGANLGSYTIPMAIHVGPSGLVLAFEPFRWLSQLLTANVAMNGLMNVWVFQLGLGDTPERKKLQQPQLRSFSSPGGVKLEEQTKSLDEVKDCFLLFFILASNFPVVRF